MGKSMGDLEIASRLLSENIRAASGAYQFRHLFFHYKTGIQQPPLYPCITNNLKEFLDKEAPAYDTVVLVCHSQGGIVAKRYILEELIQGRGENLKVDLIVTLNTPHRGARWWTHPALALAYCANTVSRMGKGRFLRQLAELNAFSKNVRFLKTNWRAPLIAKEKGRAAPSSRYVRSIALASRWDLLVSKKSAEGFYDDAPNYRAGGHPVDSEEVAEYIGNCLAEHEPPLDVYRELDKLKSDLNSWQVYESAGREDASQELSESGNLHSRSSSYPDSKATCLLEDFPDAFRRHPLRKLNLSQSFRTYVRKVLKD
jgi:hypothetical protein